MCRMCQSNGKPYKIPDVPPILKSCVGSATPFGVTGVDFTGTLYVKIKPIGKCKACICLFICASTRAIHLEIITDLSTETFLEDFPIVEDFHLR